MREMSFEHEGATHTLAATFAASVKIAEQVEDPLLIVREAALEGAMLKLRMPYTTKFSFTVKNVPKILHIGLAAAGSKLTLDDVQEIVFNRGFVHARLIAADYIALIVEPKPTRPEVEPEDEDADDDAAAAGNG